jgi:DNA repair photolyase
VRWDNLRVDAKEQAGAQLPGYRDPAVVRRFDAPEAMNVRFYEVLAKSALNRVPEQSRMPFRWTINPYRGCTHACVFCVSGETPVLMAHGGSSPIAELRVGDEVFGFEGAAGDRQLSRTPILAHWSTRRPAWKLTLADGRELVTSADHVFLSERGWRSVASPGEHAAMDVGDVLVGVDGGATDELRVVAVEHLGDEIDMYDITTGTGDFVANGVVSHNCFARPTHKYLDFNAREDFEREIVVKANVPEVLRAELARPSWKREHVALGTNTDPYQWVEGRYRLMPEIWRALLQSGTPCSVLTKSPLLVRDIDVMRELARSVGFTANLSVPTLDEEAWRATEPHTPHPRKRLEAVAELNAAGIPTGVLIGPMIPGVNDSPEQVEEIVALARDAGAGSISGIPLHLRGEVRDIWFDWLRARRPDLLALYERLYRRGAYMPKNERERLTGLVRGGSPRRGRWLRYATGHEDAEHLPPAESQPSLF